MSASSTDAVANGGTRKSVPPISATAESRSHLRDRFESSAHYARFAVSGAVDIFNGEPIERFAAVGKLDDRTLRMRAQELREEVFASAMDVRGKRKEIGG